MVHFILMMTFLILKFICVLFVCNSNLFLGPRNYGKSIEWKLEGDPWVSEGLYSDNTRGIYLLCLILQVT